MKTLEAIGSSFCVSPVQKKLACRGSSNSETVCFRLDRYAGETDLLTCNCTIKMKNREGKSDLAVPEVTADGKKLNVAWTLSSGATAAAGPLLVQIQFEKIFDDSGKNVSWQSNVMEFEIPDSLDAADEIAGQEPTLFQQWEEKVSTLYSDAAADVQTMQGLQNQVQANAAAAAVSAQSAQTGAQTAQQQADAARQAAAEAQQKVDAFSGYAKTDIDDGFANAFLGEKSGGSLLLDDVKAGTDFISLKLSGSDGGVSSAVVTTCGKNLWDYTKSLSGSGTYNSVTLIENGFTMTKDGTKTVTANIPIAIPAGTVFVVSAGLSKNSALTRIDIPLRFTDSAGTIHYDHILFSAGYEVITAAADYKSIQFYFESKDADGSEVTFLNPQIELGNQRTAYEPYRAQASYAVAPSAPLLSGDSYELVSGVETHPQAVYQHPAQRIPACAPNAAVLTSAGAVSVRYCRDSNLVLKKIEDAIGVTL